MESSQKIDTYIDLKTTLQASYLAFCEYFFPLLTGDKLYIPQPLGRESHIITIAKELTYIFRNPANRSVINVEPGSGKSTLLSLWMAWALSRYPDCNFIYISYGLDLAAKHNETVKRIIMLPEYRAIFGVWIDPTARGKQFFRTNFGGECSAFGSSGPVTGMNAGKIGLERFSGAVIIDDAHKPDEVHSDTMRQWVITNYQQTIEQRPRGMNVPIIVIAQRLHEADLCAFLLNGGDGHVWRRTILKAIDSAGNVLCPHKNTKEKLLIKEKTDIYTFASQYQQDPQPAGGALYKPEMFPLLDEEPKLLCTFITADTAETSKSYNDASVFSFWGLYETTFEGMTMSNLSLHWIDCLEFRAEPRDLRDIFFGFLHRCQLHDVPPCLIAVEKKSTGVTLLSLLSEIRGIEIRNIDRTIESGNKSYRFLSMQPYIAEKRITFTKGDVHVAACIEHMRKITANETHANDDICDTVYDAIRFAIVDKTLKNRYMPKDTVKGVADLSEILRNKVNAKKRSYNYG